jgi:hypothetical protein
MRNGAVLRRGSACLRLTANDHVVTRSRAALRRRSSRRRSSGAGSRSTQPSRGRSGPDELKEIRRELHAADRRIKNFIDAIADGRSSDAIYTALCSEEKRVERLGDDLKVAEAVNADLFQPPPRGWVEEALRSPPGSGAGARADVHDVLSQDVAASAHMLREVLGEVRLEPTMPEVGRPYLTAHGKLGVLSLQAWHNRRRASRRQRGGKRKPAGGLEGANPPTSGEGSKPSRLWS